MTPVDNIPNYASTSLRWQSYLRDAVIIFIVLLLSYAFFIPSLSKNSGSRLALTASIVETGALSIDKYVPSSSNPDVAYYQGHLYSDKAPGLSFLAVPAFYIAKKLFGADISAALWPTDTFHLVLYITTFATCGIVTAASGACLFLTALRIFGSYGGAVFSALAYGLGTPIWGWATNFFGHAISGAWLVLGFCFLLLLLDAGSIRRAAVIGFASGLFFGVSTVVEYTAAPAAIVIIVAFVVLSMRQRGAQSTLIAILPVLVGGLLIAVALSIYNRLAFGSPFTLGYSNVEGFQGMREGLFGVTAPSPSVLFQITIGHYRGIFWLSPIVMLSPVASIILWRVRDYRFCLAVCAAIPIYYFLLNASYYYWNGGDSLGPRHITPALGFMVLPLAGLWGAASRLARRLMGSLLALSMGISLACVSVGMTPPEKIKDPLFEIVFPQFLAGELPSVTKHAFGPTGIINVFPLILFWLICALALRWLHAASERAVQ